MNDEHRKVSSLGMQTAALLVAATLWAGGCVAKDGAGPEDGAGSTTSPGTATSAGTATSPGTTGGTDGAGSDGESATGEPDCWQHYTEAECLAESSVCQFIPALSALLGPDEACAPIEEVVGWCPPGPWGGAGV